MTRRKRKLPNAVRTLIPNFSWDYIIIMGYTDAKAIHSTHSKDR